MSGYEDMSYFDEEKYLFNIDQADKGLLLKDQSYKPIDVRIIPKFSEEIPDYQMKPDFSEFTLEQIKDLLDQEYPKN